MMSRADAIAQLQSLRQEARAKAYPRFLPYVPELLSAHFLLYGLHWHLRWNKPLFLRDLQ